MFAQVLGSDLAVLDFDSDLNVLDLAVLDLAVLDLAALDLDSDLAVSDRFIAFQSSGFTRTFSTSSMTTVVVNMEIRLSTLLIWELGTSKRCRVKIHGTNGRM